MQVKQRSSATFFGGSAGHVASNVAVMTFFGSALTASAFMAVSTTYHGVPSTR